MLPGPKLIAAKVFITRLYWFLSVYIYGLILSIVISTVLIKLIDYNILSFIVVPKERKAVEDLEIKIETEDDIRNLYKALKEEKEKLLMSKMEENKKYYENDRKMRLQDPKTTKFPVVTPDDISTCKSRIMRYYKEISDYFLTVVSKST